MIMMMTKEKFSSMVEKIYVGHNGDVSFMDSVLLVAEFFQIDVQDTPKYITPSVKERIKSEAIKNKQLKPSEEDGSDGSGKKGKFGDLSEFLYPRNSTTTTP